MLQTVMAYLLKFPISPLILSPATTDVLIIQLQSQMEACKGLSLRVRPDEHASAVCGTADGAAPHPARAARTGVPYTANLQHE